MKWAGHVAHMVERRGYTEFWLGNLREGDHLGDLDVDRRIILGSSGSRMWGCGLNRVS